MVRSPFFPRRADPLTALRFSQRGGQRGCSGGAVSGPTHVHGCYGCACPVSTQIICTQKGSSLQSPLLGMICSFNESRHHSRIALALNCKEHVELHLAVGREIHKMMNGQTLYIFGMTQDIFLQVVFRGRATKERFC